MKFTDYFLPSDRQKALNMRSAWFANVENASKYLNDGDFKNAQICAGQTLIILEDLRRMFVDPDEEKLNDLKNYMDYQMQVRKDWF